MKKILISALFLFNSPCLFAQQEGVAEGNIPQTPNFPVPDLPQLLPASQEDLDPLPVEPHTVGQILLQTVENEDTRLYSEWMQFSLNHFNIAEFVSLINSRTGQGNNLFHAMTQVQDPSAKEFFAREIKSFTALFKLKFRSHRVLGGEKIIIPAFRNTTLGPLTRAYRRSPNNTTTTELVSAMHKLKNSPVKLLIQNLIGQSQGLSVLMSLFERSHSLNTANSFAGLLTGYSNDPDPLLLSIEGLKTYKYLLEDFKRTLLSHNKAGKIPVETAVNSGNLQAWKAIKAHSQTDRQADDKAGDSVGVGIATLMGSVFLLFTLDAALLGAISELATSWVTNLSKFSGISESTVGLLLTSSVWAPSIVAGVAHYKCKDIVSRFRIHKNNRKQPASI